MTLSLNRKLVQPGGDGTLKSVVAAQCGEKNHNSTITFIESSRKLSLRTGRDQLIWAPAALRFTVIVFVMRTQMQTRRQTEVLRGRKTFIELMEQVQNKDKSPKHKRELMKT